MNNATPYHTLFRITTFSEQVCALQLTWRPLRLNKKNNWEENMTRHDLKADQSLPKVLPLGYVFHL